MAGIRTMLFDGIFFHFVQNPQPSSVKDTALASAAACFLSSPLSYAAHLCMTESSFADATRRIKTSTFVQFAKNRAFAFAEISTRLITYTLGHVLISRYHTKKMS